MKAATGELNLTVITISAIALVILFFSAVLWPSIKTTLNTQWGNAAKCYNDQGQEINCNSGK